jgi:Rrf2 family protein
MQFTKAEEYGVQGVLYLAEQNSGKITPLSEISDACRIPEKFLAKIFQSLTKTGIVRSHRGVHGGFTMARDPKKLPVKDVLEAIQGPYHLVKDSPGGSKSSFNALRELLHIAEDRLVSAFQQYSVGDLIKWQKGRRVTK